MTLAGAPGGAWQGLVRFHGQAERAARASGVEDVESAVAGLELAGGGITGAHLQAGEATGCGVPVDAAMAGPIAEGGFRILDPSPFRYKRIPADQPFIGKAAI